MLALEPDIGTLGPGEVTVMVGAATRGAEFVTVTVTVLASQASFFLPGAPRETPERRATAATEESLILK